MNSVRVRFTRGEGVKFISHLDMMKVFERAIRRSGLPIAYSQGFNPHPQMVFGLPLAVGMTSEGEYADFELTQKIEPAQFMERLNASLPEAIRVTAAAEKYSGANIMASICGADYEIEVYLNEEYNLDRMKKEIELLLARDSIKVMKEVKAKGGRRKGGKGKGGAGGDSESGGITLKETEIRHLIHNVEVEPAQSMPDGYKEFKSAFVVRAKFSAGSEANLRPDVFINMLKEQEKMPIEAYRIHRKALYMASGGRMTDPLDPAALS